MILLPPLSLSSPLCSLHLLLAPVSFLSLPLSHSLSSPQYLPACCLLLGIGRAATQVAFEIKRTCRVVQVSHLLPPPPISSHLLPSPPTSSHLLLLPLLLLFDGCSYVHRGGAVYPLAILTKEGMAAPSR